MQRRILALLALSFICAVFSSAQAPAKSDDKKPDAVEKKSDSSEKKPDSDKPGEPPKPKAFADVVKDAKVTKGLFTLYQTDDQTYLEILPGQFDKLFMFTMTCDSGIGEQGFYAITDCGETPVLFHKQGKIVQLVARNVRFAADANSPMERSVRRSFSDSILATGDVEGQPHPDRKSVLVKLDGMMLSDIPMMGYALESTFRIPYHFDPKNSYFGTLKSFERNVEIEAVAHYLVDHPAVPPLQMPGSPPPPPTPPPPHNLPDMRSMQLHFRYSISEMPDAGFRPRIADDRVGHFLTQIQDFSTDDAHFETSRRYIMRWRLEKQDPSAPLSRPKQPIVFWLENTIPVEYRGAIREGVLLWNKAFERVGIQDAIEVKQQPDDADWDGADVRYNTIRWFDSYPDAGFAEAEGKVNPMTGEVYAADIRFDASMTRYFHREADEFVSPAGMAWNDHAQTPYFPQWHHSPFGLCDILRGKVMDGEFSYNLLLLRGMDPQGPDAKKFIHDYLVEIAAHEVGHTLGLRHNFRASTIHTLAQAQDADLTAREGLTGSVMDYIPTNIALPGQKQGPYHQTVLGPYDYWAIEYAYKSIDAATPDGELPELRKIASRASEPQLAYDTDEDAGISDDPFDMDPMVNRFDFGSDPLEYYAHRVKLAHEVWGNMESKLEQSGEGYQVLRRSFNGAFNQAGYSMVLTSKYIGGVYHYRDHVGDPGNRLPLAPVPAAKQRAALEILRQNLFAPGAFQFSPRLLNKLASTRFTDFTDFQAMGHMRWDLPIHDMVLTLQNTVLDRLYHPLVLTRILDSESGSSDPGQTFGAAVLFTELQDSIWAETKSPTASLNIDSYRRSLQRAHLRKLIGLALRDTQAPEDAQMIARMNLIALRTQLHAVAVAPSLKMNVETRAHLNESISRIDDALKANMQRTAF